MADDTIWDGVDRRAKHRMPPIPEGADKPMWEYMFGQFELLNIKLNAMHIDSVNHKSETHMMKMDIEAIKKGFPKNDDGERDFDGHHDYHGNLIKASKRWGEWLNNAGKNLFSGLVWATVLFVAYSIWEKIKRDINGH